MKSKNNKTSFDPINLKIISELMVFYMSHGAKDVDVNLKLQDNYVTLSLSAEIQPTPEELLMKALEPLKTPRQHELENYYWQLGGEDEDNDLTLIGVMIDEVEYKYENNRLSILITRGF